MTGVRVAGAASRRALRPRVAAATGTGRSGFALTGLDAAPLAEWAELGERAAADNVFFDPDFTAPMARLLGAEVSLATVRDGTGALIAASPVTDARLGRLALAVRLFGSQYAPLGAPVIAREALAAGAMGLVEGLTRGGRSLILPDIPLDSDVAHALRDVARQTQRSVAVIGAHRRGLLTKPADGSFNPREALSAKRRGEYRRQMLRLADQGVVSVEAATDETAVREAFEAFLILEAAGWKGRGSTALLSRQASADFARVVVARLAARGKARIDTIRVVGKPVAMLVSFRAGTTAYSWKIAYDEHFARFSPGAQLMLEAGRAIFAEGAAERIDSCAVANHPMVDHLWKDRVAIGTMIIGPPRGGFAQAAGLLAAKAEISARAMLRKLRRRRG